MAALDKTYASSFEEWKEVMDWARTAKFTCPNGMVIKVINYCYYPYSTDEEIKEEISRYGSIAIMNTPCEVDYFLIKYCPIQIVQDRMREVYEENYIISVLNGTSKYDKFVRPEGGKHFKCIRKPLYNYPYKWINNYLNIKFKGYYSVDVFYKNQLIWYNRDNDYWKLDHELGNISSSGATVHCQSIKALIRRFRKWNLPIGCKIRVCGRYVGEYCEFIVKK